MNEQAYSLIANSVIIGIGATLAMDLWALILMRFMGISSLNYALVGRWLLYMPRGVFRHKNIATAKSINAEMLVGWAAHYLTGIAFAAALLLIVGTEWLSAPSALPAITFGIMTVSFPFFLMQPGMGFGIAAAKNPKPSSARLRSLQAHFVFGLGLYFSATLLSLLMTS